MQKQISVMLRTTFLVHLLVSAVFGLALWILPGVTLVSLGWVPDATFVDGVTTRLLGAALLALAYSSFRGWRALRWEQVSLVVQQEFVLCVFGFMGTLAGFYFMDRTVPIIGWVIAAMLAVFTLLWGWALRS